MQAAQAEEQAKGSAPAEQIFQVAMGYIPSACLSVAIRLGIADTLAEGALPVSELAIAAQANEDALYRILRALASIGVFHETAARTFANTPASKALRTGTPESVRDLALWMSNPFHLRAYAELMHTVKTGENTIKKMTGMEPFVYLGKDRVVGGEFNAAMTNLSAAVIAAVLEAYDFSGFGTLADIAGGHGMVLTSILKKHADVKGILFDQPHVVTGAAERIAELGLTGRCQMVGGDFFASLPAADNYVMKHIIHDWDDERAAKILRNCAAAMKGKGRVVLLESVMTGPNEPGFVKWMDIEMLAMPSGRERTEAEFAELFAGAGLRLTRVVPTKSPVAVIEAMKA
jgi:hypothetical protein